MYDPGERTSPLIHQLFTPFLLLPHSTLPYRCTTLASAPLLSFINYSLPSSSFPTPRSPTDVRPWRAHLFSHSSIIHSLPPPSPLHAPLQMYHPGERTSPLIHQLFTPFLLLPHSTLPYRCTTLESAPLLSFITYSLPSSPFPTPRPPTDVRPWRAHLSSHSSIIHSLPPPSPLHAPLQMYDPGERTSPLIHQLFTPFLLLPHFTPPYRCTTLESAPLLSFINYSLPSSSFPTPRPPTDVPPWRAHLSSHSSIIHSLPPPSPLHAPLQMYHPGERTSPLIHQLFTPFLLLPHSTPPYRCTTLESAPLLSFINYSLPSSSFPTPRPPTDVPPWRAHLSSHSSIIHSLPPPSPLHAPLQMYHPGERTSPLIHQLFTPFLLLPHSTPPYRCTTLESAPLLSFINYSLPSSSFPTPRPPTDVPPWRAHLSSHSSIIHSLPPPSPLHAPLQMYDPGERTSPLIHQLFTPFLLLPHSTPPYRCTTLESAPLLSFINYSLPSSSFPTPRPPTDVPPWRAHLSSHSSIIHSLPPPSPLHAPLQMYHPGERTSPLIHQLFTPFLLLPHSTPPYRCTTLESAPLLSFINYSLPSSSFPTPRPPTDVPPWRAHLSSHSSIIHSLPPPSPLHAPLQMYHPGERTSPLIHQLFTPFLLLPHSTPPYRCTTLESAPLLSFINYSLPSSSFPTPRPPTDVPPWRAHLSSHSSIIHSLPPPSPLHAPLQMYHPGERTSPLIHQLFTPFLLLPHSTPPYRCTTLESAPLLSFINYSLPSSSFPTPRPPTDVPPWRAHLSSHSSIIHSLPPPSPLHAPYRCTTLESAPLLSFINYSLPSSSFPTPRPPTDVPPWRAHLSSHSSIIHSLPPPSPLHAPLQMYHPGERTSPLIHQLFTPFLLLPHSTPPYRCTTLESAPLLSFINYSLPSSSFPTPRPPTDMYHPGERASHAAYMDSYSPSLPSVPLGSRYDPHRYNHHQLEHAMTTMAGLHDEDPSRPSPSSRPPNPPAHAHASGCPYLAAAAAAAHSGAPPSSSRSPAPPPAFAHPLFPGSSHNHSVPQHQRHHQQQQQQQQQRPHLPHPMHHHPASGGFAGSNSGQEMEWEAWEHAHPATRSWWHEGFPPPRMQQEPFPPPRMQHQEIFPSSGLYEETFLLSGLYQESFPPSHLEQQEDGRRVRMWEGRPMGRGMHEEDPSFPQPRHHRAMRPSPLPSPSQIPSPRPSRMHPLPQPRQTNHPPSSGAATIYGGGPGAASSPLPSPSQIPSPRSSRMHPLPQPRQGNHPPPPPPRIPQTHPLGPRQVPPPHHVPPHLQAHPLGHQQGSENPLSRHQGSYGQSRMPPDGGVGGGGGSYGVGRGGESARGERRWGGGGEAGGRGWGSEGAAGLSGASAGAAGNGAAAASSAVGGGGNVSGGAAATGGSGVGAVNWQREENSSSLRTAGSAAPAADPTAPPPLSATTAAPWLSRMRSSQHPERFTGGPPFASSDFPRDSRYRCLLCPSSSSASITTAHLSLLPHRPLFLDIIRLRDHMLLSHGVDPLPAHMPLALL
ncbi:unnamed protein product [Closterium sp. Naga37s-1]|nr:unnamed protein product [Closterium sp. Naga37s-1]